MWLSRKRCIVKLFTIVLIFQIMGCDTTESKEEFDLLDTSYLKYTEWHQASIPAELKDKLNIHEIEIMNLKALVNWYNLNPSRVRVSDIFDHTNYVGTVMALDIFYNYTERASYNNNLDYSYSENSWGGLMRNLHWADSDILANNFNTSYLSMWIKTNKVVNPPGFYSIDIGEISEDVIPNNRFDTEDSEPRNNYLDENEDSGLDGVFDSEEEFYDINNNPDPNNDNYSHDSYNFTRKNCEEYNDILDSEDINSNFRLDKGNNYYTYKIPFDNLENSFIVERRNSIDNNDAEWIKLKIPLNNFSEKIGEPNNQKLKSIRFCFWGLSENCMLSLVELKIGSN